MVSVTHSYVFHFVTPFGQRETTTALDVVHAAELEILPGHKGQKTPIFSEDVIERNPNPVWNCSF